MRRDPQVLLLAAFDKTRPDPEHPAWAGSLAGVIMLLGATPTHATTELAFVLVFPAFQRTHVSRNMVGLALRYALQLPTAALPGMVSDACSGPRTRITFDHGVSPSGWA